MQVDFFDDPPTIGEIHQNQIFKFVEHFQKYAKATNKVSARKIGDLNWNSKPMGNGIDMETSLMDIFKFEIQICEKWSNSMQKRNQMNLQWA